jgi:hypothetical protein
MSFGTTVLGLVSLYRWVASPFPGSSSPLMRHHVMARDQFLRINLLLRALAAVGMASILSAIR